MFEIIRSIILYDFKIVSGKRDRRKLTSLLLVNVALAISELFLVSLLGLILSVGTGNNIEKASNSILKFATDFTSKNQLVSLIIFIGLIVLKSSLTFKTSKSIMNIFCGLSISFSRDLFRGICHRIAVSKLNLNSFTEINFLLTRGVEYLILGIYSASWIVATDIFYITFMCIAIFFLNSRILFTIASAFCLVFLLLQFSSKINLKVLGTKVSKLNENTSQLIFRMVNSPREIYLYNLSDEYQDLYQRDRTEISSIQSSIYIQPFKSKYILDIAILLGMLSLLLFNMLLTNTSETEIISDLIFIVILSTRLAPPLIRCQQAFQQIKTSYGLIQNHIPTIKEIIRGYPKEKLK